MFDFFRLWFGAVFRTRHSLLLENLALRQQLTVLKRRNPKPKLSLLDKLFWVVARRFWPQWKESLLLVIPETVVRWHRAGFRLYWAMLCKVRKRIGGGRRISKQIRELIFQMVAENPTWGAPRIHGELRMLGFNVSERTISRWMRRAPRNPELAKRWLAFLRNHREAIAAMDFFTLPTITFDLLYCFFIISHDPRHILHFNITRHPTSSWIVQQLREAFPYQSAPWSHHHSAATRRLAPPLRPSGVKPHAEMILAVSPTDRRSVGHLDAIGDRRTSHRRNQAPSD